jgi:hypothetical protein
MRDSQGLATWLLSSAALLSPPLLAVVFVIVDGNVAIYKEACSIMYLLWPTSTNLESGAQSIFPSYPAISVLLSGRHS